MKDDFCFGKRVLVERGINCCGKPQGCTRMEDGCVYLEHPFKKALRAGTLDIPKPWPCTIQPELGNCNHSGCAPRG